MSRLKPRPTRRQSFSATCEGVPGRKSDLSHSGERARRAVPLRLPHPMGHAQTQITALALRIGHPASERYLATAKHLLGVECEEGAKFAHIAQILEGMHTLDDCFCAVSAEYWRHQVPRLRV
jgi:hypothetical protein